jgi:Trk K+ transport system NAD-binding subunit
MFKGVTTQIAYFMRGRTSKQNLRALLKLVLVLFGIIMTFSFIFHILMLRENQEFSWITGFYWTLTVMSTLGFGDITFHTDLGRLFSMGVLLTGTIFMLILLPFTIIQFFYAPWMQAQLESRAPKHLPPDTHGHILLTNYDAVTQALIQKLDHYQYSYYLICPDITQVLNYYDQGLSVVVGDLDNPETYEKMQINQAALVATTATDTVNTHIAFTVRDLNSSIPIIATAEDPDSVDILELAGCNRVIQLEKMLGMSLARRAEGGDTAAHVIGKYEDLIIAETMAAHTPFVGKTIEEMGLRQKIGLSVVGVWQRGVFQTAHRETRVGPTTVLVLAGSQEQLDRYNELYCIYTTTQAPVVIIGGGGVGQTTAQTLVEQGLGYHIIEQDPHIVSTLQNCIQGNAADIKVLKKAGILDAKTVIITTHDDDINVYLTLYCRRLNPEIQIISRVTQERNISTLHRAGADFVMSYASMGANVIFNLLERSDTLMVAEGLDVFKLKIPKSLIGKTIADSGIRNNTGCTLIAINIGNNLQINPDPNQPMPENAEIILIGSTESENKFLDLYVLENE